MAQPPGRSTLSSLPLPTGARHAACAPVSRRRLLRGGALLAGSCLLGPAAGAGRAATLDAARVKETVFPNGLRLVVKEARATDLACVQVWIRAGGFLEDERTSGMCHVIEHLVFKGTEIGGPGSLDAEIENLGGLLEASTEKDWTRFSCTLAGRYVGKVIAVIGDALRRPRFRPEDWEAERPVVREEIQQVRLNPEAYVAQHLFDLAYEKHPYRWDVRGNLPFVNTLDVQQVRAFYQKHYLPAQMVVVVVGDVDPAGVERAVRAAFAADTAAPKAPPALPPDERPCPRATRRPLPGLYLSGYVGLAFPAPAVSALPDTHAMDVLLTLLEHGGTGRLPRALRNVGGTVSALYETRRQTGLFLVTAATGRVEPEPVEALLRREFDFLAAHAIPPEEVAMAKNQLRGSYALDNEPYVGQAGTLGYYAAIDRWQFAADYLAQIQAITPEQVQECARNYLKTEQSVAVLLRPRGAPAAPPRPAA